MNSPSPFWNSVSEKLADLLRPTYYREAVDWPDVDHYYNAERHHFYRPHNRPEAEALVDTSHRYILAKGGEGSGKTVMGIIKDLERFRRGCHGIVVCVAAETLIDGIPIAERTSPGAVNTLCGVALAGASAVEGRAALYLVATESGDRVSVTSSHLFLTPRGWRRLRDLSVGDAIAVDGSEHGRSWFETPSGSLAGYLEGPRSCDGRSSALGERAQDRSLPPAWSTTACDLAPDGPFRACIEHCASQSTWGDLAMALRQPVACDAAWMATRHGFGESPEEASRPDSRSRSRRGPIALPGGTGAGMDCGHSVWLPRRHSRRYSQPAPRCPSGLVRCRTGQESADDHTSAFGPPNRYCNARFTRIASISFRREGEFYGIGVPGIGHYSAHGLIHHNSPDFEHFKRSLWPEFRRWCPWDMVHEKHRYRQAAEWEPTKPFMLAFVTGAIGYFGGIDKEMGWEGPNVNFAHFDEARRKDTPLALKVLDGRVRIPGPTGVPPQMWLTTTPRKHWLYDYFGPRQPGGQTDTYAAFKKDSYVFTLITKENEPNLEENYAAKRRQSLTEQEARVLLEAAWEDLEDTSHFLPSILLWDQCQTTLPLLDPNTPLVVSLDGAVTNDNFGLIATSRHWEEKLHETDVAFRFVESWTADSGPINFRGTEDAPGPERRLIWLLNNFNVVQVCFDPAQLHDMAQRLGVPGDGLAWFSEFGQQTERLIADKRLLDLISQRRVHHDGNSSLRQHIENADKKEDPETRRLRIVKRHDALKIDLAVAASMSAHRCLQLNL